MHVIIPAGQWQLEGVLTESPRSERGAVICHPHPLYGGNMNNPVVRAVEEGLQRAGCSTLRFNFRGTGESTGSYGGGVGEGDDLRRRGLLDRQDGCQGRCCSRLLVRCDGDPANRSVDTNDVALDRRRAPLSFFSLGSLQLGGVPKLFVVGDQDQYCSAAELVEQLGGVPEPKKSVILGGADHFLYGHEAAIRAAVAEFAADGGP
jgi:alpha/beta superfamily hydrolase